MVGVSPTERDLRAKLARLEERHAALQRLWRGQMPPVAPGPRRRCELCGYPRSGCGCPVGAL